MRTELFPGCEKILSRTSLVVMLGAAIALVFHWAWFCRHGLEFTDEGLYLLVAKQPWLNLFSSPFGFGLHPMYRLSGGDLGVFRVIALSGLLAAGGIFGWAWGQARGAKLFRGAGSWAIYGVILSGSLLVFSDGRRTPGYDFLVFLGAVIGWAAYFILIRGNDGGRPAWGLFMLAILLCILGKWAVAFVLVPLWVCLLVRAGQKPPGGWLGFVALLGIGLTALLGCIGVDGLQEIWKETDRTVRLMGSHGSHLIPYYAITLVNFVYRVLRAFVYGLPILFFLLWVRRHRPVWWITIQNSAGLFPLLVFPLGLWLGLAKGGFNGYSRVGSNVAAELIWLACVARIFRGIPFFGSKNRLETLGLLATPLFLGLGTATALGDYLGHGAVFFQIVGLGIWARWTNAGLNVHRVVPWLALTALFNLARAEFSLRDQFRTPPLASCVSPWKNPEGHRVYLHPRQVEVLTVLQAELSKLGFRAGDPVVAIGDLPGVVYLIGGWSPGTSWYFAYNLASHRYVEAVLASIPPEIRKKSFLIFRENSPLYVERRKEILSLLGQKEPPSAILGPLTFEEMTTRLMIWGPPQPAQPVNDRL